MVTGWGIRIGGAWPTVCQLSLIVPGAMSLGAQTAGEIKIIWRLVFLITCGLGIVAQIYLAQATRVRPFRGWFLRYGRWLMAGVYAVIAVIAFAPEIAQSLDPKLTALQIEGLLLTLVVFLSVSFVWDLLAEPREE